MRKLRATGRFLFGVYQYGQEKWWILVRISISIEVPQILINISEVEDDQWVDEHT